MEKVSIGDFGGVLAYWISRTVYELEWNVEFSLFLDAAELGYVLY